MRSSMATQHAFAGNLEQTGSNAVFSTEFASQVHQYQDVTRPTWERSQSSSRVAPDHRRSITVPTPSGSRVSNEGRRQDV